MQVIVPNALILPSIALRFPIRITMVQIGLSPSFARPGSGRGMCRRGAVRAERGGLFRRRGRVGRRIPGGASGAARPARFDQRPSGCPRARAPRPRPLPRLAFGRSTGPAAHRTSAGVAPAAACPDRARCRRRPTPRPHVGCLRSLSRTKVPDWLNKSARYAVVWDIQELATKTTWTTTPTSATQTTTSTLERTNPPPPPFFFKRVRHLRPTQKRPA